MKLKNKVKHQVHKANNNKIIVMSFNIRCEKETDIGNKDYKVRLPYIIKVIRKEKPDVISFQEVCIHQNKYLINALKDYGYEHKKRDMNKKGESNPLFFKKRRFTCLKKGTFWLSKTYKIMSNTYGGGCVRTCSYALLKDKYTHKQFSVFDVHLDHMSESARINGIKLVKRLIKEWKLDNMPHLIAGDMNDFYGSKTIKELFLNHIDASKFINNKNEYTFHNYGTDKQKIDFIALSKGIKQLDYKVITTKFNKIYPSDHYPIEVAINI